MTLDASMAGKALGSITRVLYENDILAHEGYRVLQRISREVKAQKKKMDWSVEVDRGQPILFNKVSGLCDEELTPKIIADISVCQTGNAAAIPFTKLDIAFTLSNMKEEPVSRWHIDRANPRPDPANPGSNIFQSGPLIHMQYGGHEPGHNNNLSKLSVPRWCYPPIELALLCEIVAANFYEDKWLDFRQQPSWCRSISVFEKLCWRNYFANKASFIETSSVTALNQMWANN